MKNLFLLIILFIGIVQYGVAQELNDYKYIIIPETYEFTGEKDQFQLNSLTKFLLNKVGFTTLMKTEAKPADLRQNPCLGLTTRIANNSGIFVTKLVLVLENCYGEVVFKTEEGKSRQKSYKEAYQEALRDAFKTFEEVTYQYKPEQVQETAVSQSNLPEIGEVKEKGKPEEVETEIEKTIDKEESLVKEDDERKAFLSGKFSLDEEVYVIKETSQGYGLYQKKSSEPIAILIPSGENNSFIYNSLTNQGIAYFDAESNLVVEYFNRQANKKITLKYEVMD